jgi:tetratricopeptide (TPR) repeat protein
MPIQLRETFELYQYLTSSSSDPRKGQQQDLQKQQKKLASALQDTFFVGDIGKACHDFAQMLEKQRIEHLLFVISAGDETLFDFPFELTLPHFFPTALSHVNALITQSRFGLVRTTLSDITKFNTQPLTVSAAPLKILFIAALPTADLPDSEQLISAQHHLTEALAAIHKKHAPQILIEFLYPAALSEIEKALKTHQHHIVQLSAYAPIDVKQPILHLETETGENQPVSSHELGNLLRKHSSIQLLFLNLLSTPKTADVERFLSMYVPAIVSTRCSGEAALMTHATGLFTTQFYKNLLYGQALIPALNDAKKQLQLSLEVENQYLRTELFSIKTYLNQFTEQLIDPNAPFQTKKQFYTVRGFKPTYLIGDNFIGRRPYLIQLQNAFRDGKHVCLHGLGGVGKTTLAEAFLYQYAMQEKAVVIFFRNHSQINEKYILDALNRRFATIRPDIAVISQKVLDAPEKTFLQKLQTLIYHFRENDKLVILFDNCEDIQDNLYIKDRDLAIFLKYMCENAPKNCRLLFTTRYKMLDLETVVTHIELDKLSEIEQNRLLEQSPILKSIPREERAALYVRLDGHPRSYMYLEKILKKEKTFQWSQIERTQTQIFTNLLLQEVYDRLLPDEQALFQLMSCFITQTRISILAAIAQKSVADLTPFLNTFQEWALCNLDEKAGMFSIHYLTREWMNKNILTLDKRNDFYLTIGKFCLTLMPDNIANTTINIGYGLLAKNYFELAGKNGQKDFINTSFELEYHYRTMGAYAYALQLNDAVLKQNIDEVTNSDALNNKGVLYYLMGNYEKALENLEKSLEIRLSIKPKDKQRLSESYINVSLIYRIRDTFDKALKYLKKSFEYKTKLKDRKGISIIYNNKSQVFYAKGNFPKAKQYLEKCLNIQREIHDFKGMATVHNNLGAIAHQSGDIPEALKHLAEALKIQRQYDDVYQKVKTLEIMGTIYFEQQESPPEKAVYYLMSALAWLQRLELPTQAVYEKLLIIGEKEGENQFKAIVDKVTSNQYKI